MQQLTQSLKRNSLRQLLFFGLLCPLLSYAVGEEECRYEGKIAKKKPTLTYQDVAEGKAAWRSSKYGNYNYCVESTSQDRVSSADSSSYTGDAFFLYYKTYTANTKANIVYQSNHQGYICISGCSSEAAKSLIVKCETGD